MLESKKEKLIQKIKAIREKTLENGCTEQEAYIAAAMVEKLMNDYDISLTEVEVRGEEWDTLEIDTGKMVKGDLHHVIIAIGEFTDTKVWLSRKFVGFDKRGRRQTMVTYCFFGTQKDTEIAHFMYDMLQTAFKQEVKAYQKSKAYQENPNHGRTKTVSFKLGMSNRLSYRLQEMKQKQQESNQESGLMLYDKLAIVEEEFLKQTGLKLTKESKRRSKVDYGAYDSGQAAGDRVNISPGVKNSGGLKSLGS
jgi:hypothetical protein